MKDNDFRSLNDANDLNADVGGDDVSSISDDEDGDVCST